MSNANQEIDDVDKKNNLRQFFQINFATEDEFKSALIEKNRGKYLFLILCRNITGISISTLLSLVPEHLNKFNKSNSSKFNFYAFGDESHLLIALAGIENFKQAEGPNIDGALGRLQNEISSSGKGDFEFGIGRTRCNFVSDTDEIYEELLNTSQQNLTDNLIRWSWTKFNRANDYFASLEADAVIQPILFYDHHYETYSMKGGEVFVGGKVYKSYRQLIDDIPPQQDMNRIDLLITEKLVESCKGAPGLLKFNVSPQTLIDTFNTDDKVYRFSEILKKNGLNPMNVRIELIEKPYEEKDMELKDVCRLFWQYGISFAADDFGVKSQSHQVVLDLGEMIKEFKLDPISFKFKPEEDHTKFLDNLAFIDYCKRLADNREAIITAEAVDDYDTLRFLIAHQVYHFQTNLFCKKISIKQYSEIYEDMQELTEEAVRKILTSDDLLKKQKRVGNIFKVAQQAGMF